jgi:hypothetical protein
MNLSASALIRPLLRHVFQILGSTKPILSVPKLALILKDLCGANSSVSLLCGTIIASMRATRSFADFACDTRLDLIWEHFELRTMPPTESNVLLKLKMPSIGT